MNHPVLLLTFGHVLFTTCVGDLNSFTQMINDDAGGYLRCLNKNVLYIVSAVYRPQFFPCPGIDVKSDLEHNCFGKEECHVVPPEDLSDDQCPQKPKVLTIQYGCMLPQVPHTSVFKTQTPRTHNERHKFTTLSSVVKQTFESTSPMMPERQTNKSQLVAAITGGVVVGVIFIVVIVILLLRRQFWSCRKSNPESDKQTKDVTNMTYNLPIYASSIVINSTDTYNDDQVTYNINNKPRISFTANKDYATGDYNAASNNCIRQNVHTHCDERNTYDHCKVEFTGFDMYDHTNNRTRPYMSDNIYDHASDFETDGSYDTTCVWNKRNNETSTMYESSQ